LGKEENIINVGGHLEHDESNISEEKKEGGGTIYCLEHRRERGVTAIYNAHPAETCVRKKKGGDDGMTTSGENWRKWVQLLRKQSSYK